MENILITTSSYGKEDPAPLEVLTEAGYNVILNPYQRKLIQGEVHDLISMHKPVGMIAGVEPLTAEVLKIADKLKVISRCGVGLDNIDQEVAFERGIKIINTPTAPCKSVAELTVTLILASLRKIVEANQSVKQGVWVRPRGQLLGGKVIGIIGCGRIGTTVASLLAGFDVKLLGFDAYLTEHYLIKLVNLDELITGSDIITLHLPLTESTEHMVNDTFLKSMQLGSILVNTSRGGLIDEQALYDNLLSGHLNSACIDTFEQEPYNGKLVKLPNAILTPHIGSYTRESRISMEIEAALNLLETLKSEVI